MIEIIPAILTDDGEELVEMISKSEGKVDRVQIDIIDGVYSDNKTIMPEVMAEIDTSLLIDYHLMVKEPINWIERCMDGFADRVIGQVEMMKSQIDYVKKVQEVGVRVGLALDLDTPVSMLENTVLADLDVVLLMSVPAGHGGQKFDKSVLEKISKLVKLREDSKGRFRICDDGGIILNNIEDVSGVGVDEVAVGRRLFKGDLSVNIERYKRFSYGETKDKNIT